MSRSVYSLVLSEEIVDAVDRMACEQRTSRSGLIDRILAGYFSCPTPEMRMKAVCDEVERLFAGESGFQVQPQPSDAMMSLRSALHYRYRPTVRYVLELFPSGPAAGELRVSLRSQSRPLLDRLDGFFTAWRQTEDSLVGGRFPGGRVECRVEDGRYRRLLAPDSAGSELTGPELAEVAGRYIRLFDGCLKEWFAAEESARLLRRLADEYRGFLADGPAL